MNGKAVEAIDTIDGTPALSIYSVVTDPGQVHIATSNGELSFSHRDPEVLMRRVAIAIGGRYRVGMVDGPRGFTEITIDDA